MPRPIKTNLSGISPIRRAFHTLKARNDAIDEYEAYLAEVGIELPEYKVAEVEEVSVEQEKTEPETIMNVDSFEAEVEVKLDKEEKE